jgi:hypothetical protein
MGNIKSDEGALAWMLSFLGTDDYRTIEILDELGDGKLAYWIGLIHFIAVE